MKKFSVIDKFAWNEEISDESIYAIHRFLEEIYFEFERSGYYRLRRHLKSRKELEARRSTAFSEEDPF
jgi:hypothetical protein